MKLLFHKSSAEEFTDKDWENFNSYMVHRFISMNVYYTELADLAQSLMPNNKKQIYNLYKEMIPKKKKLTLNILKLRSQQKIKN